MIVQDTKIDFRNIDLIDMFLKKNNIGYEEVFLEIKYVDNFMKIYTCEIVKRGDKIMLYRSGNYGLGHTSTPRYIESIFDKNVRVKKIPREPKYGDIYYFVNKEKCCVEKNKWTKTYYDDGRRVECNIFKTQKEAEQHKDSVMMINKLIYTRLNEVTKNIFEKLFIKGETI